MPGIAARTFACAALSFARSLKLMYEGTAIVSRIASSSITIKSSIIVKARSSTIRRRPCGRSSIGLLFQGSGVRSIGRRGDGRPPQNGDRHPMQTQPSSGGHPLPIAAAGAMPETLYSIDQLLEQVVAQNASDLHLTAGTAPILRLRGQLCRMEGYAVLSPEDTRQLLYRVMSTEQQKQLEIDRQVDMAHSIPSLARFRVNVY